MVVRFITWIGSYTLACASTIGMFVLFILQTIKATYESRIHVQKIIFHMYLIGVRSIVIIALTGLFTGMVFALQSYIGFQRIGGEQLIGAIVSLGMIRELGPIMTAIMITGRAGSSITAEIGMMRISEQIDALTTLRINPFHYLIIPRIIAGTIILPCLSMLAIACGILGGYIVVTSMLHLSAETYLSSIKYFVELHDVYTGIIKSAIFGCIIMWISTFKGFYCHGGTRGVATATTETVVVSSICILISNYFLTRILEWL